MPAVKEAHTGLVDIIPFLEPFETGQKALQGETYKYPPGTRLRFPICYTGWEAQERLVKDLRRAALSTLAASHFQGRTFCLLDQKSLKTALHKFLLDALEIAFMIKKGLAQGLVKKVWLQLVQPAATSTSEVIRKGVEQIGTRPQQSYQQKKRIVVH